MENKLTIEKLAPYLPYGLKIIDETDNLIAKIYTTGTEYEPVLNKIQELVELCTMWHLRNIKPILRPLSSLTKPIEHKGETFVPIERLGELCGSQHFNETILKAMAPAKLYIKTMPYWAIKLLQKWMFDLDGLIEAGLAIDVDTLETNPYK